MITTITFNFKPRPQQNRYRARFIPRLETIPENDPFESSKIPIRSYNPGGWKSLWSKL
jgi:hypothetical protein